MEKMSGRGAADFYFTCKGANPLSDPLSTGKATLNSTKHALKQLKDNVNFNCGSTLDPMTITLDAGIASMNNIEARLNCSSLNPIVTKFTRDAICKHMVDGLYYLWPVQAASAFLLLLALIVLSMVRLSFYPNPTKNIVPESEIFDGDANDNEMITSPEGQESCAADAYVTTNEDQPAAADPGSEAIANMDYDGNGAIDAGELAAATGVSEDQAAAQIAQADYDGDGQLTAEEINYASGQQQQQQQQ